jgi:hypothetical protein
MYLYKTPGEAVMERGSDFKPRIINGVDTSVGTLPTLLDVAETARALRLSPASVRAAIRRKEIPSVKIAGRVKVISQQLLAVFDDAEKARLARVRETPD